MVICLLGPVRVLSVPCSSGQTRRALLLFCERERALQWAKWLVGCIARLDQVLMLLDLIIVGFIQSGSQVFSLVIS